MAEATDDKLRLLIERIERLKEEQKGIGEDIRDTFNEGKSQGYDTKMMRKAIKLRSMSPQDRAEADAILQAYCCALGIQIELPLGVAA
ncbi:hypothetical protein SKP52_02490 [Sphingopyxis fribergensis]|uniref:GapR-like DNA-binding domain-containing protein n=1 Tax=Sphingopyxis fribergensis TaxID=1515612 RepID=A0A0A7PDX1_9SPHN|nr:DUF2312 domain-containing protein [Sphingopyxis fribergensis]AJA07433.1 hypothetical protein SKP52_02490 [Sphingopyxis fribergensis]